MNKKQRCLHAVLGMMLSVAPVGLAEERQFGSGENEFTMDFVSIGALGNAPQSAANRDHAQSGGDGIGAVGYSYRIGTYQVTIDQFVKAQAASGGEISNGNENLWQTARGVHAPATMVSWYEAARFCNWLTSGSATEGAYVFDSSGALVAVDRAAAIRSYREVFVLPSRDEWAKAAYYNIAAKKYSLFAFGVDSEPVDGVEANYRLDGEPQYSTWAVGSGAVEQNGTYDMMGNVWEWSEQASGANYRTLGGSYVLAASYMESDSSYAWDPSSEKQYIGFRVVRVARTLGLYVVLSN